MSDTKSCRIVAVCIIVFAAACIVSSITALATMGTVYGLLPGPGEVVTYLYQINAFFCAFAVQFGCAVLAKGTTRRRLLILSAAWAMLILCVMYYTPFITESVQYLAAMDALAAFRYLAAYLPFMLLVAALVGVISTWNSASHRAAGIAAMSCALASVFASVVYLWQVIPSAIEADTAFDAAQIWAIVFGYCTVTLVCLECWFGSVSNDSFASVFGRENLVEADAELELELEDDANVQSSQVEDMPDNTAESNDGTGGAYTQKVFLDEVSVDSSINGQQNETASSPEQDISHDERESQAPPPKP